ncbi:helix-turn-helix domain-containing protein [Streptomyces sp. NPDC018000]|uniref:helix-turn-helix domain-containing protein n=1 Tax=Streptomyces sp. NPDC018000 TaxID=3365028 RepID=UPI0037B395B8
MGENMPTPPPTGAPAGQSDLGRRVAARRQELGLTREELAERSGAAASYIAYLEERAAIPDVRALVGLADALETTVAELAGTTVERPPGPGVALPHARLVAMSHEECRRSVSTHGVGRIAFVTSQGPAVFPVNYVVAGDDIAFRTTADGLLAAAAGTEVAFEVDHIDDAMSKGWSVMAVGRATAITDDAAIRRLDLVARSLPWAGGSRTHWMTVTPTRVTGRRVVQR